MEFWRKLKLRWDSNVTIVIDDYTARSSQELTVSKGQHVRIIQKQLLNAPDWCLIRVLNDQHQQNHSNLSSLGASSITITNTIPDLSLSLPSKYNEGLVPTAILKLTKSSSTNLQLPPPLTLPIITNKTDQGNFSRVFSNELSSKIDESQHRSSPSSNIQLNKRKSSFRLKDNNMNKDTKSASPTFIMTTPIATFSEENDHSTPVHRRPPLPFNSTNSRKVKAFTFANTEDLTSFPDTTK
ncbi:hypothetical protein I4U23_001877 [Adineta vaga]|nr:hypothetical protein I4U23_001877 [Adineta vaga]